MMLLTCISNTVHTEFSSPTLAINFNKMAICYSADDDLQHLALKGVEDIELGRETWEFYTRLHTANQNIKGLTYHLT